MVNKGDNKFLSIAAASIIAKVERDKYIYNLCDENPYLREIYHLDTNKGYGTKQHMDAIRTYGITKSGIEKHLVYVKMQNCLIILLLKKI